MSGKSKSTQEKSSWCLIDHESELVGGDVATYELGDGGLRNVIVLGHLTDGRVILQQGTPGVRRGDDAFDIYIKPDLWRFVAGLRGRSS